MPVCSCDEFMSFPAETAVCSFTHEGRVPTDDTQQWFAVRAEDVPLFVSTVEGPALSAFMRARALQDRVAVPDCLVVRAAFPDARRRSSFVASAGFHAKVFAFAPHRSILAWFSCNGRRCWFSPYTWTTSDDPIDISLSIHGRDAWSLRRALLVARTDPATLFFRKVTRGARFDEAFLDVLYGPEQRVREAGAICLAAMRVERRDVRLKRTQRAAFAEVRRQERRGSCAAVCAALCRGAARYRFTWGVFERCDLDMLRFARKAHALLCASLAAAVGAAFMAGNETGWYITTTSAAAVWFMSTVPVRVYDSGSLIGHGDT